jgi:hypothetical protein
MYKVCCARIIFYFYPVNYNGTRRSVITEGRLITPSSQWCHRTPCSLPLNYALRPPFSRPTAPRYNNRYYFWTARAQVQSRTVHDVRVRLNRTTSHARPKHTHSLMEIIMYKPSGRTCNTLSIHVCVCVYLCVNS